MISSDKLCMSCMREIGDARKCPHCGYYADSTQISPYLPVRTVIANRYMVGKMLEYNGEGATYIGWDLVEKKAIKIREFIPDSFTIRSTSNLTLQIMRGSETIFRDLRRSFEEMWTKLARLKGLSALISVNDVVEDYGTSYAIYDHFEGITLRDFLLRSNTGYITWERARQLLMPVLSALGTLHSAAIIHRGISPSTLVIGTDGKIKITGFCVGAARTARSDLNSQLYDGYAAIEQYGFDGQQGTWTDIYAFAAVLYRTLIGSDPISAKERMTNDRLMVPGKFAEALPAYVINGLINALQILPDDRTRTVEQLRAELSASPVATAVSGQYQRTAVKPAAPPRQPQQPKAPVNQPSAPAAPKKKKKLGSIALMLLSVGITFVVGMSSLVIFLLVSEKPEDTVTSVSEEEKIVTVNLDKFRGTYVTEFSNQFGDKFNNIEYKYESNNDLEKDKIISISPDVYSADNKYSSNTKITVTVSTGKAKNPLPDNLEGLKYSEVEKRLTDLGFICDRTEVETSNLSKDEIVISLTPSGKADSNFEYEAGTKVSIKVYAYDGVHEYDENGEPVTDENGNYVYVEEEEPTNDDEHLSEDETEYVNDDEEEDVTDENGSEDIPEEVTEEYIEQ